MTQDRDAGRVLFPEGDTIRTYANPLTTVAAARLDEVRPALAALERHVGQGRHVAGYIAYEAAAAFDPALRTHSAAEYPLLWFGVYDAPRQALAPRPEAPAEAEIPWRARMDEATYIQAADRIRAHIAAGDTYQVNFTFPLEAEFNQDPERWFHARLAAQGSRYSAFIDLGSHQILSLSPELFFSLDGDTLATRPMKGTRPRGLASTADDALAAELRRSDKECAENLMIVDMLRNDLGRVCAVNSIQVPELFSVERYPTVWQMTSTITGATAASVPDIFAALFPPASVTGAPKVETMKIIRALETAPRGVYCGAIGWWGPDRQAQFSVAIRTAVVEAASGTARYPVGSGITWDADPAAEYRECLQKTAVLQYTRPAFSVISALRLDEAGYVLRDFHLDRVTASAAYFGYPTTRDALRQALENYAPEVTERPAKIRLTLDRHGTIALTHAALPKPRAWKVGLALTPVESMQPWTHHKTTHRAVYDAARATRPECDDVLLWTRDGCLTEAANANIVLRFGDDFYTPPLEHGLLNGVYRRHLLETGAVAEKTLTLDDLVRATEIHLINSVRRWIPVDWAPHPDAPASLQDTRQHAQ